MILVLLASHSVSPRGNVYHKRLTGTQGFLGKHQDNLFLLRIQEFPHEQETCNVHNTVSSYHPAHTTGHSLLKHNHIIEHHQIFQAKRNKNPTTLFDSHRHMHRNTM